jgi:dihydrofolate reductase
MTSTDPEAPSRRVVANFSLSLDGRVNGPGGEYDMGWIVPHAVSDEAREHMVRFMDSATTVLLGRKNYQGFSQYWPPVAHDDTADLHDRTFARWLNAVDKIVFSTTLDATGWEHAHIVDQDPAAVVAELRDQPGGDIIVLASISIIQQLLQANAVDRLSITLCPELVGGGTRLFEDGLPPTSWTLTDATPTSTGAQCLLYDRTHPA